MEDKTTKRYPIEGVENTYQNWQWWDLHKEWIDNFEVTSQSTGDLEQMYEDLLREECERQIRLSKGLDWKSLAHMCASHYTKFGIRVESICES